MTLWLCSIIKAMSICAYLWTTNAYVHKYIIVCAYIFWSSILLSLSCKCQFSTYSEAIINSYIPIERSFTKRTCMYMYTFTAVYIRTYIWIIITLLKYAFLCVNITLFQVMAHENVFGMWRVLYWIGNCFITNESNIFIKEYA